MKHSLVIGTRGSALALAQANWVSSQLQQNSNLEITIQIIKTSGDVKTEPLSMIGGKGVFTKELEDALLDGRVDIAVHSLKDLPTILPDGLQIGAICEREDPRDALVLPATAASTEASLIKLVPQSVVGTSSPRRLSQLMHLRPDLVIKDLRGNVETRLRKLDEGQYDALILASAGLRRLNLAHRITIPISPAEMLPAVGQGAIGIEVRADDDIALETVRRIDHPPTSYACVAERAMLRTLGGGCQLPIAGHATVFDRELRLEGLVATKDGAEVIRDQIVGPSVDGESLGRQLADRLLQHGANRLLEAENQRP